MKACYTLDINAKTGGKGVGRREYDDTKYRLCASLKGKQMEQFSDSYFDNRIFQFHQSDLIIEA